AFLGGAAALGRARSGFAVGADADVVTLRDEMLDCASGDADGVLDRWIFSARTSIDCVYARGRQVVQNGAHVARAPIRAKFVATMRRLLAS
ncbi:MAG: formimidoylglutamate deiminase, partial [Pseudomonadota bacterium]|nr:formimidoylglutamate deiminase [Pseudomonadota bacterium]